MTNSSRFVAVDSYQLLVNLAWYETMLANRAQRHRTYGIERGTKYGREMMSVPAIRNHTKDNNIWDYLDNVYVGLKANPGLSEHSEGYGTTQTAPDDDDDDVVKRHLGAKLVAEVKLVLVVLDVLLVLHRFVNLYGDVLSLRSASRQQKCDAYARAAATELRLMDAFDVRTGDGRGQSERDSSSRDHRTCPKLEFVDVTRCFIVAILCTAVSVLVMFPSGAIDGPTEAAISLSRLVPNNPTTVRPSSNDSWQDWRSSAADISRQYIKFDLRQLLALSLFYGNNKKPTVSYYNLVNN